MSEDLTISLERIKSLIAIGTKINSSYSDFDSLFTSILESACSVVDCETASLMLVRREGGLQFAVALGSDGPELKKFIVDDNSIAGWVARNNEAAIVNDVAHDPRFNSTIQDKTHFITHNMIAFPMEVESECVGVIELINKKGGFSPSDLTVLNLMGALAGNVYENVRTYLRDRDQIGLLQNVIDAGPEYHSFVAQNPRILKILEDIDAIAQTNSSVLIYGESGVGKELFAEQIQLRSNRRNKPFVRVSCAALSPSLLESELFGHVKGAFTSAVSSQKGRFELADGGTIFLDEIGELPLDLQAKLLRVLQEHKFERVGSSETISADVRVIAATNRNLEEMVEQKLFRNDLYFRLNVLPLNIPPLRERKEDIEPLCKLFIDRFSHETKKKFSGISNSALKAMYSYWWPGNVRELENTIERACILGKPPLIQAGDLQFLSASLKSDQVTDEDPLVDEISSSQDKSLHTALNAFKKQYLQKILSDHNWNQTKAARTLGIQRTYLSRLISELNITR